MSGLTVTAAALGSPALARLTSHPAFAGAALLVGAAHQAQAWGNVGGLLSGALLFLGSVATAVSGYSFFRGFKAGWQALKASSRLAVYDRVQDLQREAEALLKDAAAKTKHPVLKQAREMAEANRADVKAAAEHFRDLRDEKPQRIEAAYFSGLANNPTVFDMMSHRLETAVQPKVAPMLTAIRKGGTELAPDAVQTIRRRTVEAAQAALQDLRLSDLIAIDDAAYETLRATAFRKLGETVNALKTQKLAGDQAHAYPVLYKILCEVMDETLAKARADGITLSENRVSVAVRRRIEDAAAEAEDAAEKAALASRLVPAQLSVLGSELEPGAAAVVKEALEKTLEIERLLATTRKGGSVIDRWRALPKSPTKAERAERDAKAEENPMVKPLADPRGYIRKTTLHAGEAQRVASASPRNWVTEAIGDPTYSPTEKKVGHWLGQAVNGSLLYAVPTLATMQMLAGGYAYLQQSQTSATGFIAQMVTWALSLAPAAATYLYNARQGSRRFNVSPAASQELPMERYAEKPLQETTSARLDRAVPPMEEGERERFVESTRETLAKVEASIRTLEGLDVPGRSNPNSKANVVLAREPWKVERSRNFTPIENPDPRRAYAYDHKPGGPDTEDKKRIRTAIKGMSLEQLEEAIRRGEVTHVDILNMICDHPAAQDGAVVPRPLTGKLRRKLMKLAREADRTGVIRHFIAVKDLFPGVDGVVTAGSKTTYLTDLGRSPLMDRIIEQGFIPIPCGLTAGANGGSGLYNGHGAVGNPNAAGHDTGGSSSAAAYLLSLDDMPIRLAIGTDTGGSISAPCGAAKLIGWVPEKGMFSRINMIPFATHLDTPGVMGVSRDEVMWMAKLLTVPSYQSHYQAPKSAPDVYYFKTDVGLVSDASQANFARQLDALRAKGFEVNELGEEFAAFRQIPLDLYADSYVAAGFTLMNPLENNRIEPQRYILDRNLQNRLAKANALLKAHDPEFGNLFNRFLDLHVRFRNVVHRKFPEGSVFVTPTPEAVGLEDFRPNGAAGTKLDSHDILGGMLKNRTDRALFVDSDNRIVIEGRTGDVLAVSEGHNATAMAARVEDEFRERFPNLAQDRYTALVSLLAKNAVRAWSDAGASLTAADAQDGRIPEVYLEKTLGDLVKSLKQANKKDVLDELVAHNQGLRARRAARRATQASAPHAA